MRIKILALSLLLAVSAAGEARPISAKQSRVIELVSKDDGTRIVTIRINDRCLLYEFNNGSEAALFTEDSLFTINHKNKTYRVQSYAELEMLATKKAAEIAQSPLDSAAERGFELKPTAETETISGVTVRKLIQLTKGEPQAQFWLSAELLPASMRAFGERIKTILAKDYLNRTPGNAGLIEIMTLFGVPLKISYDGHGTYQAQVAESSIPDSMFRVPADYKRLDN